jgi:hypothetical protein
MRSKHILPEVDPIPVSDEESVAFIERVSKKQVKKKKECEHIYDSEALCPVCHKCGEDMPSEHVAYKADVKLPPYQLSKWHIWFRYIMFLVMGIMLTLAYFKFFYVIHTTGLGDLLLIRK